MATEKDKEQDQMIRDNAVRITRNEEAIKRQTEALEQIRDHYYPPPAGWWKKASAFFAKVVCVIVAYLGIAETVNWLWNVREADARAARYAEIGMRLYSVDGDVPGAISCFEQAANLNEKNSDYAMTLTFLKGMALVGEYLANERPPTDAEQARIDTALADATVLKELEPRNPKPYVLIAQALLLSGEKTEAVATVEQAVALAPNVAAVRVSACAINYYAGRVAEARAHLAEAERLDASLPLVAAWKGLLALWCDHDAAAARACFEATVRRLPRFPSAYLALGRALLAEKNPDLKRARSVFSKALVLNAKLRGALQGMADSYEREGNLVMARLWLDRALALDRNYLPSLVARARIAVQTGDAALAVRDLTAAIALAPFRADLYRQRADAFEKSGDAAKAKADRETSASLRASEDLEGIQNGKTSG